MGKSKKKIYELKQNESISECLDRMASDGYQPIRRIEKPFFKEGANGPEYVAQQIVFEGILKENTNNEK